MAKQRYSMLSVHPDLIRLMMSDQQLDEEPIVTAHWVPPADDSWGNNLCPVTIFQVLQGESSPSSSLVNEGKGFAAVTLVAHVICVEMNPAQASYILEDGTGRIHADKELDSLTHQLGLSAEEVEEEITQYKAFEHTYVEVMGTLKNTKWKPRIKINTIRPVHGYPQVMYHILNVIHSNMLSQPEQCIQSYDSDQDFGPNEDMENMPVDDGQANQNDLSIQHHITYAIPASPPILPNTFSPQKHSPYATLKPLERAIMKYMRHHRDHHVLIAELAHVIQQSHGCTETQFHLAIQVLLSEAYITSPLDDGYVVTTPRH